MRRILIVLAAATAVFLASCDKAGPASLRLQNASASAVTNVRIGGNDVGAVAAGAYSPSFEFDADTWVESSWSFGLSDDVVYNRLVESGDWDMRWDGSHVDLVER
jgi:hypothetical protein